MTKTFTIAAILAMAAATAQAHAAPTTLATSGNWTAEQDITENASAVCSVLNEHNEHHNMTLGVTVRAGDQTVALLAADPAWKITTPSETLKIGLSFDTGRPWLGFGRWMGNGFYYAIPTAETADFAHRFTSSTWIAVTGDMAPDGPPAKIDLVGVAGSVWDAFKNCATRVNPAVASLFAGSAP